MDVLTIQVTARGFIGMGSDALLREHQAIEQMMQFWPVHSLHTDHHCRNTCVRQHAH